MEHLPDDDASRIDRAINHAAAEQHHIDDATARLIASQLHGGQWSAFYSFASTGTIDAERLATEIAEVAELPDDQVRAWLGHFAAYAAVNGPRGPVEGWHSRT